MSASRHFPPLRQLPRRLVFGLALIAACAGGALPAFSQDGSAAADDAAESEGADTDADAKTDAAAAALRAALLRAGEKPLEGEFVIREKLSAFFADLAAGSVADAFADLLKGSKIAEKQENLDRLVRSTRDVLDKFGTLGDSELIAATRVGSRSVRFAYLSYGEDFPLLWYFYCYRNDGIWQILDLSVNNDLDQIFGVGIEARDSGDPILPVDQPTR